MRASSDQAVAHPRVLLSSPKPSWSCTSLRGKMAFPLAIQTNTQVKRWAARPLALRTRGCAPSPRLAQQRHQLSSSSLASRFDRSIHALVSLWSLRPNVSQRPDRTPAYETRKPSARGHEQARCARWEPFVPCRGLSVTQRLPLHHVALPNILSSEGGLCDSLWAISFGSRF